jgi:sugar phosphate permease
MFTPGLIGLSVGLLVLAAVRDKPTDLGYPAVDTPAPAAAAVKQDTDKPQQQQEKQKQGGGMMAALSSVMKLPAIWALAFTYFFIYVVRQGVTNWMVFYLMAEKGAADARTAALTVSGLELGGLAGSTVAGLLSDRAIRGAKEGSGLVGKRIQVGWVCRGVLIFGSVIVCVGCLLEWVSAAVCVSRCLQGLVTLEDPRLHIPVFVSQQFWHLCNSALSTACHS